MSDQLTVGGFVAYHDGRLTIVADIPDLTGWIERCTIGKFTVAADDPRTATNSVTQPARQAPHKNTPDLPNPTTEVEA